MHYWNKLLEELIRADRIVVYGAGLMGRMVKKCLEDLQIPVKIQSFLVESLQNNPADIEGVPVIELARASAYKETWILAALHEKHMEGALEQLSEAGFRRVWPLSFDSDEWSDIRGNWFWNLWKEQKKYYVDLNQISDTNLHIYVAHSIADRPLKEWKEMRGFEIPIQVGAALTKERILEVTDDYGENISEKNRKYCELTGLYWMWKHDSAKYQGLSHYRRRFDIGQEIAEKLPGTDIDAVVTVPLLNLDGVKQQYGKDHIGRDWNMMMETVGELSPSYLTTARDIEKGNFYYGYNMLIARQEIVNEYCRWLFPILFCCEEKIGEHQGYQGRYIGFLAERLMTIFLEHHKKRYKLAVAKKHFIKT